MRLAAEGASLSLAARNTERLDELDREWHRRGGPVVAVPTDVTNEQDCQKLIEQPKQQFGRIYLLVNNAGFNVAQEANTHSA